MDKEKEIEEMASAISKSCEEQIEKNRCASLRCEMCMAEFMTNAGYRKADEVRKETAKEILLYLKATITDGLLKNHEILNALMKEYGVEV